LVRPHRRSGWGLPTKVWSFEDDAVSIDILEDRVAGGWIYAEELEQ
jgi:hypothetical protein